MYVVCVCVCAHVCTNMHDQMHVLPVRLYDCLSVLLSACAYRKKSVFAHVGLYLVMHARMSVYVCVCALVLPSLSGQI